MLTVIAHCAVTLIHPGVKHMRPSQCFQELTDFAASYNAHQAVINCFIKRNGQPLLHGGPFRVFVCTVHCASPDPDAY